MVAVPIKDRIVTEGAEIYCERRGSGPLMLLTTGAIGDAGFYSAAADILAAATLEAREIYQLT
jgi:hypothetical protein